METSRFRGHGFKFAKCKSSEAKLAVGWSHGALSMFRRAAGTGPKGPKDGAWSAFITFLLRQRCGHNDRRPRMVVGLAGWWLNLLNPLKKMRVRELG